MKSFLTITLVILLFSCVQTENKALQERIGPFQLSLTNYSDGFSEDDKTEIALVIEYVADTADNFPDRVVISNRQILDLEESIDTAIYYYHNLDVAINELLEMYEGYTKEDLLNTDFSYGGGPGIFNVSIWKQEKDSNDLTFKVKLDERGNFGGRSSSFFKPKIAALSLEEVKQLKAWVTEVIEQNGTKKEE